MTGREVLREFRVVGDDGSWLKVLELRHHSEIETAHGVRRLIGSRDFLLSTGEAVRSLGRDLFEVIATGELLQIL